MARLSKIFNASSNLVNFSIALGIAGIIGCTYLDNTKQPSGSIIESDISVIDLTPSEPRKIVFSDKIAPTLVGHKDFCNRNPKDCGPLRSDVQPFAWSLEKQMQIQAINKHYNHTIEPVTDQEQYGTVEYWTYAKDKGDCEDISLTKKRALMEEMGIAEENLPLAYALQPNGEGHIVLLLLEQDERGQEFIHVLDNLTDEIRQPIDTPYHFLRLQSPTNSAQWLKFDVMGNHYNENSNDEHPMRLPLPKPDYLS